MSDGWIRRQKSSSNAIMAQKPSRLDGRLRSFRPRAANGPQGGLGLCFVSRRPWRIPTRETGSRRLNMAVRGNRQT